MSTRAAVSLDDEQVLGRHAPGGHLVVPIVHSYVEWRRLHPQGRPGDMPR